MLENGINLYDNVNWFTKTTDITLSKISFRLFGMYFTGSCQTFLVMFSNFILFLIESTYIYLEYAKDKNLPKRV